MGDNQAIAGRGDGDSGLYPLTRTAFHALIEAEIWTGQLLDAASRFKQALDGFQDRDTLWYVPPPDPDDPADLQALVADSRKDMPETLKYLWRDADSWYNFERRFRQVMERAKKAADSAAVELDSPATPPLARTSVAIKRSLRDLSGSVPYANTAGWGLGAVQEVIESTRRALQPVRRWTDELRLLVQPEHTMRPPQHLPTWEPPLDPLPVGDGKGSEPPKPAQKKSKKEKGAKKEKSKKARRLEMAQRGDAIGLAKELTSLHKRVLHFLQDKGVTSPGGKWTASMVADIGFKGQNRGSISNACVSLKQLLLLDSEEGTLGGYWLTELGQKVIRAMVDATPGNGKDEDPEQQQSSAESSPF